MSRRKEREQAFALLFEKLFNDRPVTELAEGAAEARDEVAEAFALEFLQACLCMRHYSWQYIQQPSLSAVTELSHPFLLSIR